jgi:hypothetical protein
MCSHLFWTALFIERLLAALEALVVPEVLRPHFPGIGVQPLEEVHIILESAFRHLLKCKRLFDFELDEGFVENL